MAQSVEQLIRNQQVRGSSPLIGSTQQRGVAQFGSAFGSGPKGRRFKSCHLDHQKRLKFFRRFSLFSIRSERGLSMELSILHFLIVCPLVGIAGFIDADLQHSPDLIPEMLKAVDEEGYDVAACKRVDRDGEKGLKSFLSGVFYKVVNLITETYIDDGAQDYRIMNRNVIDSILAMQENVRFTKGIFSWVGFNVKWFPHHNRERAAGETKWSLVKLLKYAIDGIIGYTSSPLRFPLYMGVLSLLIGFVYTVVLLVLTGVNGASAGLGIAGIIDAVIIVGGLILLSIGIAGEYLSRIYTEVKNRPKYLVAKTNVKK